MSNIINAMYIQQLTENVLQSVKNTIGMCKKIAILIFN